MLILPSPHRDPEPWTQREVDAIAQHHDVSRATLDDDHTLRVKFNDDSETEIDSVARLAFGAFLASLDAERDAVVILRPGHAQEWNDHPIGGRLIQYRGPYERDPTTARHVRHLTRELDDTDAGVWHAYGTAWTAHDAAERMRSILDY